MATQTAGAAKASNLYPYEIFLRLAPLALALRIAIAIAFPNIIARDEVFQYLEQAHRLIFGQGYIPWEYQIGLRNWFMPLLLAALMAVAHVVIASPLAGLILIRLLLCTASLSILWAAIGWGAAYHGRRGALIAGLLTALWPDLWLFAPHTLEEVFAADCLVPALYLIDTSRVRGDAGRVFTAAFLLGLAVTFREQLALAAAIATSALCGRDPRAWRTALLAGALPLLAAGVLDWLTWGEPFRSFWLNIEVNAEASRNLTGGSPASFYLITLLLDWLWTFPVIIFLIWRGAVRAPLAGLVILAIIIPHSLIAHKEFRYIFPAIAVAIPLAGIGLAGALSQITPPRVLWTVILLAGPLCSPWLYFWLNFETISFAAFERLAALHPKLVATGPWLDDFVPLDILFGPGTRLTDLAALGPARPDAIVALAGTHNIPASFNRGSCYQAVWIPLARHQGEPFCIWTASSPGTGAASAPQAQIPFFPPEARTFIESKRQLF